LTLRRVRNDDADDLLALRSNEKVMEYLDRPHLKDLEEALAYINKLKESYEQNNGINWMLTQTGEDRVIGTIGY
jgi:ribosomal-protein-alanine N-acetyltransferase